MPNNRKETAMHLCILGLLTLGAAVVEGYRDTSPFFFASTSELFTSSSQLKTARSLLEDVRNKLEGCHSDYYVIASQPGVHATDYSTRQSAPRLRERVMGGDKAIRSSFTVTEVVGEVDLGYIRHLLEEKCGVHLTEIDASIGSHPTSFGKGPRIISVTFPMLPLSPERSQQLINNDAFLAGVIDQVPSQSYTFLYITSPKEFVDGEVTDSFVYHPENSAYQEPLHMDLKRDYVAHSRGPSLPSNQSLFQRYQFLSPGIFMGLFASFICLSILYVGLSALMSLQVPYAAFEKNTAPGSQKKQQ
ncbi:BIG/ATPase V1 complex, subunit S1 [Elaphomyces granulatus]